MSIRKPVLWALLLVMICSTSVYSVFHTGRKLHQTQTRYFNIIFADNSRDTALYIATFADEYYEKINSYVSNSRTEKITVVVSDDNDEAQGYANTMPGRSVITIFDTPAPIDSTVGNSSDFVRYEFFHELVHIISLNTRSDLLNFFAAIFGNWVYPQASQPGFMVEGVTVSFESLTGEGRVNYPYIAETLKQDIVDDNFKSPPQASGAFNTFPNRSIFYFYGGYFSDYLQKKYGMAKYRELWHSSGENIFAALGGGMMMNGGLFDAYFPFAFLGNVFGLGSSFRSVYGTSIESEWDEFKKSMAYKGKLDINSSKLDTGRGEFITPWIVKGKLYYLDYFNDAVFCYDLKTKELKTLIEGAGGESIAVSADGSELLYTRYATKDSRKGISKAVIEFKTLSGEDKDRDKIYGLREAAFFNDKIIGIRAKNHFTDLVLVDENGEFITLLAGKTNLYFSTPRQLNDQEITMLVNDNGKMKIGRYNMTTKTAEVLDAPVQYVRNIGVYDGKILFSYNNDMTFYKLAVLDGNTLTLQTNNISGGVFYPMTEDDKIYYTAQFTGSHNFMAFPETLSGLKGQKTTASFVKLAATDDTSNRATPYTGKIEDYNPLPYFAPIGWIPTIGFKGYNSLDLDTLKSWVLNNNFRGVDNVGIYTRIMDPTEQNSVGISLGYTFKDLNLESNYQFVNFNIDWDSIMLPVHFRIIADDRLIYSIDNELYLRSLTGYIDINYTIHFDAYYQFLTIGLSDQFNLLNCDDGSSLAPYLWPEIYNSLTSKIYLKLGLYTMYDSYRIFNYRRGLEINAYSETITPQILENGLDAFSDSYFISGGNVVYYPYYLPLAFKVQGAFSTLDNQLTPENQGFYEYSTNDYASYFYLGGEAIVEVLNIDINWGLPIMMPLYANQLSLTAGYRGAYLDQSYLQSAFARLTLTMPYLYGQLSSVKVNFYGEGYYKITDNEFGYRLSLEFGNQFGSD